MCTHNLCFELKKEISKFIFYFIVLFIFFYLNISVWFFSYFSYISAMIRCEFLFSLVFRCVFSKSCQINWETNIDISVLRLKTDTLTVRDWRHKQPIYFFRPQNAGPRFPPNHPCDKMCLGNSVLLSLSTGTRLYSDNIPENDYDKRKPVVLLIM